MSRNSGRGGQHTHTAPTITEAVEKLLTRFDGDGNDTVSKAELLAVLNPTGTSTTVAAKVDALLVAFDSDGDGSLSTAEFTTALGKLDTDGDGLLEKSDRSATGADSASYTLLSVLDGHGGRHAAPTPLTVTAAADKLFARYDTSADAGITEAELLAKLDPNGTNITLQARIDALFPNIDSDNNGSLSNAEVTASLTAVDSNGDGAISRAESHATLPDSVALIGIMLNPGCAG